MIHVSVITAGIFSCGIEGVSSAIFNMISHSLAISTLLIAMEIIENKFGSEEETTAVANCFPSVVVISSIAILSLTFTPFSPCFTGTLLIVSAYFADHSLFSIISCVVITYGAFCLLRPCYKIFFGDPTIAGKFTLAGHELACLVPATVFMIFIGFFPGNMIRSLSYSVAGVLQKNYVGVFE
jgi:NADH:ubiquinone oxidoreductase subunit 4 (subunit M)